MVRKKTESQSTQPIELRLERDLAEGRIIDRIEHGRSLMVRPVTSTSDYDSLQKEYSKWNLFNAELLKQLFTTDELANEYSAYTLSPMIVAAYHAESFSQKVSTLKDGIDRKIHRLDSIIDRLELYSVVSGVSDSQTSISGTPTPPVYSNKVFIVHGRDDAAKGNLEAFVRENRLEPIVLHRQADEGQTVIEKFEKHSDVGYAFILLTPDELAYLASESSKPELSRDVERRARPNVIFEWGYFVGKLGRSRVCCISTGSVDLPSDMNGLVTKRYQSSIDEVAYNILKDLRAAGYSV